MFDDFQAPLYFERYANIFVQDRDLLRRAFTHRSYLNEAEDAALRDNERLEFLGDAVLGFSGFHLGSANLTTDQRHQRRCRRLVAELALPTVTQYGQVQRLMQELGAALAASQPASV